MTNGGDLILQTEQVTAELLRALAETLKDIALTNKKAHGQAVVAKALLSGDKTTYYGFNKTSAKKLTELKKQLDKMGINYIETATDNENVIIIKDADKTLMQDAIKKANVELTKQYIDKHPEVQNRSNREGEKR